MNLKRRVITAASATTAITLLLGAGSFVISRMIVKDGDRIVAAQRKIDEQYALRRSLRGSATDLSATKKDVGKLVSRFIQEGGELGFVRALETAADATGVTQDIRLETVNQKELTGWEKEIPLSLTLTGSYPQVLRHLAAVERLPYTVIVNAVSITADPDPLKPSVRANVSGHVRWVGNSAPDFVFGRDDGNDVKTP